MMLRLLTAQNQIEQHFVTNISNNKKTFLTFVNQVYLVHCKASVLRNKTIK